MKDGKMIVTWDSAKGAKKYNVYRGVSRFSEYEQIGQTIDTTFIDENPNASK